MHVGLQLHIKKRFFYYIKLSISIKNHSKFKTNVTEFLNVENNFEQFISLNRDYSRQSCWKHIYLCMYIVQTIKIKGFLIFHFKFPHNACDAVNGFPDILRILHICSYLTHCLTFKLFTEGSSQLSITGPKSMFLTLTSLFFLPMGFASQQTVTIRVMKW